MGLTQNISLGAGCWHIGSLVGALQKQLSLAYLGAQMTCQSYCDLTEITDSQH